MRKIISLMMVLIFISFQSKAQYYSTGNSTVVIIYNYVPVQQPVQSQQSSVSNDVVYASQPATNTQTPVPVADNSTKWLNTLNVIEKTVDVLGKVITVTDQGYQIIQAMRHPQSNGQQNIQAVQSVRAVSL